MSDEARKNPLVSLADLTLDAWEQGSLYKSADTSFGKLLGLRNLGIGYSEVPPGKSSCPFHNHHQEDELFVILEGEGTYRFGEIHDDLKRQRLAGGGVQSAGVNGGA